MEYHIYGVTYGVPSTHRYIFNTCGFCHGYLPIIKCSITKAETKGKLVSVDKINAIKSQESSLSRVVRICNTINEMMQRQQLNRPRRSSVTPAKYLQKKEVQNVAVDQQETADNLYRWWVATNTAAENTEDEVRFEDIQKHQHNHYPRWSDNESFLNVQDDDLVNIGELQMTSCESEQQFIDSSATNFIMKGEFSINIVAELNALIADNNY